MASHTQEQTFGINSDTASKRISLPPLPRRAAPRFTSHRIASRTMIIRGVIRRVNSVHSNYQIRRKIYRCEIRAGGLTCVRASERGWRERAGEIYTFQYDRLYQFCATERRGRRGEDNVAEHSPLRIVRNTVCCNEFAGSVVIN